MVFLMSSSSAAFLRQRLRLLHEHRFMRTGLTIGAGWGSRMVSALAQFVAVRILTSMLGVEGFAAWAVITSLLTWFMLADFGLGAALQNHISARRATESDAYDTIRATAHVLFRSTGLTWLLLALISPWIGPFLLEGFPSIATADAALAFFTFGALATATGASSVALKVCFAEHRGYVAHLTTAAGTLAGLLGLLLVAQIELEHRLSWALLANYAPLVILSALLFWRRIGRTTARSAWRQELASLQTQAGHFLLFAALSALVLNVDFVVLARTVTPGEVATYAIFVKIYGLVFFVFSSVLQAYWPLCTEAFHRGNAVQLRSLMARCIGFGLVTVTGASLLLFLLHRRIAVLLAPGHSLELPTSLILYFVGYWFLRVWSDTFSMLVLSAGRTMFLCKIVPVQAVISLGLGTWGAQEYGLPGFMLGLSASFALTVVWALPLYVRNLIHYHHEERT